jgi:hypothetical protein
MGQAPMPIIRYRQYLPSIKCIFALVDINHVLPRWAKRNTFDGERMTNQAPVQENSSTPQKSPLRPWIYGYSSAALPVSAIAALGLYLGSQTQSTLLSVAVIELLPIGAYTGYKAMRNLKKNCGDSIAGFIICCALLLGAAAPVVMSWLRS